MSFPQPRYFGTRRLWPLSELVNWEREQAGLPALESDPADEQWRTAAQVRKRYGGVSDMWLWRRTRGQSRLPGPDEATQSTR